MLLQRRADAIWHSYREVKAAFTYSLLLRDRPVMLNVLIFVLSIPVPLRKREERTYAAWLSSPLSLLLRNLLSFKNVLEKKREYPEIRFFESGKSIHTLALSLIHHLRQETIPHFDLNFQSPSEVGSALRLQSSFQATLWAPGVHW